MERRNKVLRGLDVTRLTGLEIGPLANPLVRKSDGNILYVDYADTPALRQRYANDPHVNVENIVHVDAVWGAKTMTEVMGGTCVDYIIASHVIEHVPDLITWLKELNSVLSSNGEVRLVVPDKRYTFDCLRAETRLCDVVSTYLIHARVPQPREIIDFCTNKVEIDVAAAWRGGIDRSGLPRSFTFEGAVWLAQDVINNGTYHDVHCWVFTPYSFACLCVELAQAALLDFRCKSFSTTEHSQLEFYIAMEKSENQNDILESWRNMVRHTENEDR